MPFLVAALWSISATFGIQFLGAATAQLYSADHLDLVSDVLCAAAVFVGTLFLIVRVHERERTLSDALALRPTLVSLCLLAGGIGAVAELPFNVMAELIARRYPASAADLALQAEVFAVTTLPRKVALVLAAGIIGPLAEELFFRGGLYRGIRRMHGAALSVVGVAFFFAVAHLGNFAVPLFVVPIFCVGLMLGHVRSISGSLWPAVILHAAFNAVSAITLVRGEPDRPDGPLPSIRVSLGYLALTLALVGLYHFIASRSAICKDAREQDLA